MNVCFTTTNIVNLFQHKKKLDRRCDDLMFNRFCYLRILKPMDSKEIFSVTLILFSVIDILGSIPFVILIRNREGRIYAEKATLIAAVLMIVFLFLGQSILKLFGLDVGSFAVAGAIVMFFIAMEMILGMAI